MFVHKVCRSSVKYTYSFAQGNFLISIHIRQHEAGKHCHYHFMSTRDNILWQGVHRGPDPSGRGHGVLGVAQEPVLLLAHQAPVHRPRLECVDELQDGLTAPEALVLEVVDTGARPPVGPVHNLCLCDQGPRPESGEQGQGVGPHQLPHDSHGQAGMSLHDV